MQINKTTRITNTDALNWTIEIEKERATGEKYWEICGYYRTLGGALEHLPHKVLLNQTELKDLNDVVTTIRKLEKDLRKLLKELKEVGKQNI